MHSTRRKKALRWRSLSLLVIYYILPIGQTAIETQSMHSHVPEKCDSEAYLFLVHNWQSASWCKLLYVQSLLPTLEWVVQLRSKLQLGFHQRDHSWRTARTGDLSRLVDDAHNGLWKHPLAHPNDRWQLDQPGKKKHSNKENVRRKNTCFSLSLFTRAHDFSVRMCWYDCLHMCWWCLSSHVQLMSLHMCNDVCLHMC